MKDELLETLYKDWVGNVWLLIQSVVQRDSVHDIDSCGVRVWNQKERRIRLARVWQAGKAEEESTHGLRSSSNLPADITWCTKRASVLDSGRNSECVEQVRRPFSHRKTMKLQHLR
jgi:hypothetical protein